MSLHREPDFELSATWECRDCGTLLGEEDVASIGDGLDEPVRYRCRCGAEGVFVARDPTRRGERSIAKRWGEDVAACGWTPTPNVLVENLGPLGLDAVDHLLLELLEQYRRVAADPAWPGRATLARLAGKSEAQVTRRLGRMVAQGLIERETRRHGGHWPGSAYTRHGLTRALALIAANRRARGSDEDGLAELLNELRQGARMRSGESSTTAHPRALVEVFLGSSPEQPGRTHAPWTRAHLETAQGAPMRPEEEVEVKKQQQETPGGAREQARAASLTLEHPRLGASNGDGAQVVGNEGEDPW